MQEHNKENNDFNEKNCFNQDDNYNSKNCFYEKKVIMYLIIIALLLFYCSLFFIHNINFKANKKDKELLDMEYNEKDDENKQNNNTIGNNITNGNNNIINSIISSNATNNNSGDGQTSNSNGESNNPEGGINNPSGIANNPGGTSNPNGGSNNLGGEASNPNGESNNPGGETSNPGGDTNNPGGETSKPGEGTSIPDEDIVNNKDRFKITQGSKEWKDLKSLNIFNNAYFNGNSIIAPNVYGKYNFTVENYKDAKILYNLKFMENNEYNINMVYKLKLNGVYIAGNEKTFVKYTDLNTNDIVINEHTKDVFTLEWKWQDSDNDTQIGKAQGANYKINIEVNASELNN